MSESGVGYTQTELESVLPSGWSLATGPGLEAAKKRKKPAAWSVRVQDVADVDWSLEVEREAVERLGRMEALRQAMDKLAREALG